MGIAACSAAATVTMSDDDKFLDRAFELAERGRGFVEPNPLVGAVIARDGVIVGEGWHAQYGGPHAEVVALNHAADLARGATLYVTLEPCCHTGKTPPCTDAVIRAGIARVVAAMTDPFPQVAGQGIARLRGAGIDVTAGAGEARARIQNAPYLTLILQHRPYVHAKWAMTLDGKIATRSGDSKWISGEESRRRVHMLRGRMDAIIVGAGTVRADDPLLTARPPGPRTPARIVLSSSGSLPEACQLLRTLDQAPVIVTGAASRTDKHSEVLSAPIENGRASVSALLTELGHRRMTNVLVEGGAQTLGSFFEADLVDEVHVFIAPRILAGDGLPAIVGRGMDRMNDALRLAQWDHEVIGEDLYVHGRLRDFAKVLTSPA
jgi:diaminohydroxyphosphoribosylaminopyrimidine deaminase/5-amino-6-(5-phosphoribosylamino)uracil reductase